MTYSIEETESAVVLKPAEAANSAIIWLHGLGADGYDFVPIVEEMHLLFCRMNVKREFIAKNFKNFIDGIKGRSPLVITFFKSSNHGLADRSLLSYFSVADQTRDDVRWIWEDWNVQIFQLLLHSSRVELLESAIALVSGLVLDGGSGTRHYSWRKYCCEDQTSINIISTCLKLYRGK